MIQGISFAANRNTFSINSNYLPRAQTVTDQNFREALSSNRQNSSPPAINGSFSRDNLLNAISQARVGTAAVFNAPVTIRNTEPFSTSNYYDMSPEEVRPLLKQLEEEILSTDFSGMSNLEIYEFIENKFIDTFGEDFMKAHNLLMVVPGSGMFNNSDRPMSNYEYVDIGHSFKDMVSVKIGYAEMLQVNRTRQFGDMSNSEVINAVIANHPQPLTNRSLALIGAELQSVGISDDIGFGRYVDALLLRRDELPWNSNYPHWNELEERWNILLDQRADIQHMASLHNAILSDTRPNPHSLPWVMQTKDILVKLGAKLGPDGLFLQSENRIFVDLDIKLGGASDSDDLLDEFIESLNKHEKKLRESKERYESNRESAEVGKLYESNSDSYHSSSVSTSDFV
ncbi:MAG: hypothetical protein LBC84_04295, partial [Prevotellaceae bacterium]|nr:hypothetical protein [Prevotellaceae bacterium]